MGNNNKEELNMRKKKMSTRTMVTGALLTALVIALQFVSMAIRTGTFSITLSLVPIVIGAIICGKGMGAWLGFVFGVTVIATGDAAPFMAVDILGTILTVLLKGTACGFVSGLVYEVIKKIFCKNKSTSYVGAVISAIACPITNTGVFLLGCLAFFMETLAQWGAGLGFGSNVGKYMIFGLVGTNFLIEMAVIIVFAPAIVRVIKVAFKK